MNQSIILLPNDLLNEKLTYFHARCDMIMIIDIMIVKIRHLEKCTIYRVIFSAVNWRNGNTCGKNTSEKNWKTSRLNTAHKQPREMSLHYGALTLELHLFCGIIDFPHNNVNAI